MGTLTSQTTSAAANHTKSAYSTSAVGTPQGDPNPGLDNTGGRVSAPVSKNNPGKADTIAQGDARSDPNCQSAA